MADKTVVPFQHRLRQEVGGSWCIVWDRPSTGGYGRVKYDGRTVNAHRAAYEAVVGAVPDGLDVDHLCRNRACVRPDHMEPVTRSENLRRSPLVGQAPGAAKAAKTHCPHGHPYSGDNLYVVPSTGYRKCLACIRARCGR